MRKIISLLLASIMVISMVGCSNETTQKKESPDDLFIEDFGKAINKRWTEQDELDEDKDISEEEYSERNVKILEEELETIEESLANVEDKELKETASQYVEGTKIQIEMFKTTDYELQYQYSEESEQLRKPALIKLVEDYGVSIDEEHEQIYRDFKEQATVINKENEANQYAEKLAQEISFERTVDEFGYVTYKTIVENTSDFEFDTLQYDVQFKDEDGIVVGNDYMSLDNFKPGNKQKVELTLVPEEAETVIISLDYLDLKE
ncbi:MAG: FxLYD domain-containing protein [Bacillus sp. (in: firmicutes)]